MRRRDFMKVLAGSAVSWPLDTRAQQSERLRRVGVLMNLAAEDPEAARIVQVRYFAGLSVEEAAQALGISRAHAYRQWTFARAWLLQALSDGDPV